MDFTTDYYLVSPSVRASLIPTTSYVAGTVIDTGGKYNQLMIYISNTKGSLTSTEFKVEFSPDATNYYQESVQTLSGGTATEREVEHTIVAANQSAAAQLYRFAIPICDRYIKISVKGTGTLTNSLIAVDVVLGVV